MGKKWQGGLRDTLRAGALERQQEEPLTPKSVAEPEMKAVRGAAEVEAQERKNTAAKTAGKVSRAILTLLGAAPAQGWQEQSSKESQSQSNKLGSQKRS